jgi:hypothetical protein
MVNPINGFLLRRGIGPAPQHLLSIAGRRSGTVHATPVAVLSIRGERFVVAGFDGSDWVRNARAAGRGWLRRGRAVEQVALAELPVAERGPILAAFARQVRGGTGFLTVPASASPAEFAAAGIRHPVFRISPVAEAGSGAGR